MRLLAQLSDCVLCDIYSTETFPGANLNNDTTLEKMANYLKNLTIRLGE